MSVVSVYAVFADAEEAERIGRAVSRSGLPPASTFSRPIRSIYRWKGRIETADEVAAIFKTHHWRSDALIARIAELHSYDVPCVVSWPIDKIVGSYADWVEDSVIRDR